MDAFAYSSPTTWHAYKQCKGCHSKSDRKKSCYENNTNSQIFALKRLIIIESSLSITERILKNLKSNIEDAE